MSQRNKKHCMIVHAYYPVGETRVQREAEMLIAHGYQVDVIALRHFPQELAEGTHNGVKIYRMPLKRVKSAGVITQFFEYLLFFILAGFKLTSLHLKERYTSIQVHNLPDFLVFTAIIPKLMGTPVILDLHDLMPEFFASRFGGKQNSLPMKLVYLQERLSCHFADHVITVTEYWRQSLIKRGLSADKSSVLMNLADSTIFVRPEGFHPANSDQFRLIYHGAIPQRYGLDLALQAIRILKDKNPLLDIHLTIIGSGDYLPALIDLTSELHLEDCVDFVKFLPAEELPARILPANCGIVPYRDDVFTNELLPTKLLEYAALGVPAIAAKTLGIATYFDDTMVKFFPPGDAPALAEAILQLANNRDELANLTKGIQIFNRRYNWLKQGADYAALIERLSEK